MAELKVLSAGAVKNGVAKMCEAFAREHGAKVDVEFTTAPGVRDRVMGGEQPDVVVAPPAFLEDLVKAGRIVPDSRAFLGRARMGVVVHVQATVRDVPDVESLKRILLGAKAIVHNKASSGIYAAKLLEQLFPKGELGSRIAVVDSGAAVIEYVVEHGAEVVGLAQISEIRVLVEKGRPVRLAAPLPDAVQNVTSYEAAALAGGPQADVAARLAAFMATAQAKTVFAATGID
jgi:molybdate transport system substrate-binding protein